MTDTGNWKVERDETDGAQNVYLASDDFTHDVWMRISGDFADIDEKLEYAQNLADRLNATRSTPGQPATGHPSQPTE